jgi:hypothetical protein
MGVHSQSATLGVLLSVGIGVAACTPSAAPGPAPQPAPAAARLGGRRTDSAGVAASASATRVAAGRAAFQVTSVASVVVAGDTSHHDTVSTQSTVRYDSRWTGAGLEVNGSVTSGSAGASVAFVATVDTATARVHLGDDSVSCPAPRAAAFAVVRDLLSAVPRSLSPGAAWTDTVTTVACRGDIPVTTTAVRQFTVTREGAAIVVAHTTAATLAGATTKGGVRIELTGRGDGQASLQYQAESGRLVGGTSTVDVALKVGAPGHPVALTQHAETRVTPVALK